MGIDMKQGFLKVAAVTPKLKVADTVFNRKQICEGIRQASKEGAKVIVFPELCISAYTCGDLFLQERLLTSCREQLREIAAYTREVDALVFVGLPIEMAGKLYNVAAALSRGEVLCMIPKAFIPSYGEFYETRYFCPGNRQAVPFSLGGKEIWFGTDILLEAQGMEGLRVGCEICEDIWAPDEPGISHALAGATVLVNLSASNETIGKDAYREMLVKSSSARLIAGYVYCSGGEGESTQDVVYGGHDIIAENGRILAQSKKFESQIVYGDLDISRLCMERRRMNTFTCGEKPGYRRISFMLKEEETKLTRSFPCLPFVPSDQKERQRRIPDVQERWWESPAAWIPRWHCL